MRHLEVSEIPAEDGPRKSKFNLRRFIRNRIKTRHYQFFLMFLTLQIIFGIRACLTVAITAMTEKTPPGPDIPTYSKWDTDIILSSFFWGYVIPQVCAGQLSEKFGPKWFLFATIIIHSLFNILIPPMTAALGSTGVIICRVVQGFSEGFLFPSVHNLISKWCPFAERTKTSNFIYSGSYLGISLAMPIVEIIAHSKVGWPVAFYVLGGLGVFWAFIFVIFIENSPSDHKKISEEERMFIERTCQGTTNKNVPTPWVSILTSLPVWAIFIAGIAQSWGLHVLLSEIPNFMESIINFDIKSNTQISGLPYMLQFLLGSIGAPLADKLIEKKIFKITTARKLYNSLAMFVPGALLIGLAFLDGSQKIWAIVLFVIAVGFTIFTFSGYVVNIIDLAPNHSGTVMGLIHGTSNIFSFLAPLSIGFGDKNDPTLWRTLFLTSAGIYIGSGIFYLIFASAQLQKWNNLEDKKSEQQQRMI